MVRSRLWLTLVCLLGFCGSALAQKQGGTLRITHRDNPPSASILEEATISTLMPFMAVFNNLVVFDPASRENRLDKIVPDLAKSWALTDNDRTLTFQLRDGVKWHDGKPFTSADVKCTFDILSGKVNGKLRKTHTRHGGSTSRILPPMAMIRWCFTLTTRNPPSWRCSPAGSRRFIRAT
ncbi:MAG: peptide/nickel transport system substrate-binding protein [Acetobacteraceae bacterium]|nr:peptide/nickel transport system substrate-binding protein [Acetobacteraceae bacterium]